MFAINFMIHVLNCLFESRDALLSKIKPDVLLKTVLSLYYYFFMKQELQSKN